MKDHYYFRRCPAKRGHGPERKALLEELKMAEIMLEHFIIMTSTYDGLHPNADWLQKRKQYEQERDALVAKLQLIVGPYRENPNW